MMKYVLGFTTWLLSFSVSAQNICPIGFEKARSNTKLDGLNSEFVLIMNNDAPIQGDGTFEGSSTFTHNGLFRMNYKQKLPADVSIESYTQIKVIGAAKWDKETCGLLTSHCLLVDHPQIKSIQIDSKKDKAVKDLRVVGIEVCRESGSNLAKKHVVDTDRSIAGGKSEREPNYKSGTLSESSRAQ